jgi:hypothetical protein
LNAYEQDKFATPVVPVLTIKDKAQAGGLAAVLEGALLMAATLAR